MSAATVLTACECPLRDTKSFGVPCNHNNYEDGPCGEQATYACLVCGIRLCGECTGSDGHDSHYWRAHTTT